MDETPIPFYQALHYQRGVVRTEVKHVVLHCMQNQEKPAAAVDCAKWLAGLNPNFPPPLTSAHYFFDAEASAQGVLEENIAWHAPGVNRSGIGLEHAGWSKQTRAEWLDEYGVAMLKRSANKAAKIAIKWAIPLNVLGPTELRAGLPGFLTHATATKAFPEKSHGHMDPGAFFPLDWYMTEVQLAVAELVRNPNA